jgi:hypothetical protein
MQIHFTIQGSLDNCMHDTFHLILSERLVHHGLVGRTGLAQGPLDFITSLETLIPATQLYLVLTRTMNLLAVLLELEAS